MTAMQAPTGTVTLVFTDIQDSTPLWERHGPRFEDCLKIHNDILRARIAACGGYEVKTEGDAFMVAFSKATDAARFALSAQQALHEAPWPPAVGEVLVRMGLHTGEPICTFDASSQRMDYLGPAVNRAARVASAGHGGQILLSDAAQSAAAEALTDARVTDLGEHRLKGLERPERIFQALPPGLEDRSFGPLHALSSLPTNLPPQATSFVGRERELRDLVALLRPRDGRQAQAISARTKLYGSGRFQKAAAPLEPAWLVTLTGAGGTGKTRLALRLGNELLDQFEGGVWFVDLASSRSMKDLCQAVASALGVPLTGREAPERVIASMLQYRKPLLLILDNFEQVVACAQGSIALWRQAAPQARFLATSRALLGIAGEREYELQPLASPPAGRARRDTSALSAFDAVTLFAQRAREADSRFELSDENVQAVAAICTELDGLPLAIELAAARVKVLKPAQMVKKLGQKFELLKSSRRDLTPRQQTLLGAIEWGFDLLNEWERLAFLQACVFNGGFFLDAAEAVLDLEGVEGAPLTLDAIQSLREKSLLTASEGRYETRFSMYRAVREFGRARWKQLAPESVSALRDRHAKFYGAYIEHWSGRMPSRDALESLDRVEMEFSNCLEALEWGLAKGDLDAATPLLNSTGAMRVRGRFEATVAPLRTLATAAAGRRDVTAMRSMTSLSRALLDSGEPAQAWELALQAAALAETLGPSTYSGHALRQLGESYRSRSEFEPAMDYFTRAANAYVAANHRHGELATLVDRAVTLRQMNRLAESEPMLIRAQAVARELGDGRSLAAVLSNMGNNAMQKGLFAEALALYRESEELARLYRDPLQLSGAVGNRGNTHALLKEFDEARRCYEEAIAIDRDIGSKSGLGIQLSNLAQLDVRCGRLEEAERHFAECQAIWAEIGHKVSLMSVMRERGHNLTLMGRYAQALPLLVEGKAGENTELGSGSLTRMQEQADLALCLFETGERARALELAAEIGRRLENPPGANHLEEVDVGRLRSVIARLLARGASE
ncbi:tetratricopeptide repeat protein [bacterium]|nr:MAG: tetratricopeptide repeat protein [bacterium]RIK62719.1 MAG: hypothetical protein DCC64_09175 [Planctomycetota bacterium]